MKLEEFLRWEDGTDTRYELLDGIPVARPIDPPAHGLLLARACSILEFGLKGRRDYLAFPSSAIAIPTKMDTCYVADLTIQSLPIAWDSQLVADPILVLEILSGETATFDRDVKAMDYRDVPSVHEILLIDSHSLRAELHKRRGFDWQIQIMPGTARVISLASVGMEISMTELYEGLVFPEDEPILHHSC